MQKDTHEEFIRGRATSFASDLEGNVSGRMNARKYDL